VWSHDTDAGTVRAVVSDRRHGDLHLIAVDGHALEARRRALVDLPWTMLDEVHGTDVVEVTHAGAADRARGDVAVTDVAGAVLGVWVGDCAPVLVVAPSGRFAVAHAGWRGLLGGILDRAVDAAVDSVAGTATSASAAGATALLGPCIGPCCYEFGAHELVRVADALDVAVDDLRRTTSWGTPSLDVPAAVAAVLARRGVPLERLGGCTCCDDRWWSHRRGERGRQVLAAWRTCRGAPS
jgi:copper oxidase (laccase) domain-containing protein